MQMPSLSVLEELYRRFNRRDCIAPDPLELLYRYRDVRDREIAGLIAALLAYGGVRQIVASAGDALARMGGAPGDFVMQATPAAMRAAFAGFRHRWTRGGDLAAVAAGTQRAIREHGSMEASFIAGLRPEHETVLPALESWVALLRRGAGIGARRDLLACPRQGSACKRLNLFLRWMARKDRVDPGLWPGVPASKLVVPLDLHMHRIARGWGLTKRRSADLKAAIEVTAAFRRVSPEDPVRYDFALTRASMRREPITGSGHPGN
jgi:uncharacterized protein (TIGR02757 family)